MATHRYEITPVPKPRQTRSDKWKERPSVMRYRAFADECRLKKVHVPESGAHITFNMPMPKSWSKKKRLATVGRAHQSRPDVDNLAKSLLDALYADDSTVWDLRITKRWAAVGSIEIITEVG